jgi:thiol-disulfide isomerase/thioredoxin
VKAASIALCAAAFGAAATLAPFDESGFTRVLAENSGKIVLFDFWATWCDPCRAELPELVKLERKWRERGLVLVTVSADSPEREAAALEFLQKSGVRFPAYIKRVKDDEAFIDSVDTEWSGALPALFLYDRAGRRAASFIGETETAKIEAEIEKLLRPGPGTQ